MHSCVDFVFHMLHISHSPVSATVGCIDLGRLVDFHSLGRGGGVGQAFMTFMDHPDGTNAALYLRPDVFFPGPEVI